MDTPLQINSGYRCQSHNISKGVGGSEKSKHTMGSAIDISYEDLTVSETLKLIKEAKKHFAVVINYPPKQFIHCHVEVE